MAIATDSFSLVSRESLTHDVFELVFERDETVGFEVGQYVMFVLPSGLRRAYSIAWTDGKTFRFVIKRLEDGKGGSREICDLPIGTSVSGMGPMGHFVLSPEATTSCLIGTGTGFAPLYAMVLALAERGMEKPTRFIFGVREKRDLFHVETLESIARKYPNFTYSLYLSREESELAEKGYVTDAISSELVSSFEVFYLCGSPAMVKDSREKLESLGVPKDRIRFEQY